MKLLYPSTESGPRNELFVVLHSHTIWKGVFFESMEQAFNIIIMFHRKCTFNKQGNSLVEKGNGKRFTVYPVKQYMTMDDIKTLAEYE